MNSHLIPIPGLGALTARGLSGGDLKDLGRKTYWSLDSQVLGLSTLNQVGSDLLQSRNLAAYVNTVSYYVLS